MLGEMGVVPMEHSVTHTALEPFEPEWAGFYNLVVLSTRRLGRSDAAAAMMRPRRQDGKGGDGRVWEGGGVVSGAVGSRLVMETASLFLPGIWHMICRLDDRCRQPAILVRRTSQNKHIGGRTSHGSTLRAAHQVWNWYDTVCRPKPSGGNHLLLSVHLWRQS